MKHSGIDNKRDNYFIHYNEFDAIPLHSREMQQRDKKGVLYTIDVSYMIEGLHTTPLMTTLLINGPKAVRCLTDYIAKHLPVDNATIVLSQTIIANEYKIYPADVNKAIRYLEDRDCLRHIKDLEGFEHEDPKKYSVRPNFMFRGSTKSLQERIDEHQGERFIKKIKVKTTEV